VTYNTLLGISDSLRHGLINYIDDKAFLKHLLFYKMLSMNKLEFSWVIESFVWISETIGGVFVFRQVSSF
jgi:hypothetical protein